MEELALISLDESIYKQFQHHQFGAICGNDKFRHSFEIAVPFGSDFQMESNTPQDFAALELQIQTLTSSEEELIEQN